MKKFFILLYIIVFAMTSCQKPEPEPDPSGGETVDTAEAVVKKYLVKQLLNDDPEKIMLSIDWNDDCTEIRHVKYGLGYGSVLDYEFTYFGRDSIRVVFSMPPDSYPLWSFWYDSVMLHLQQERVDSICCFANGGLRHVEHYYDDDNGRMIERTYLWGSRDTFSWEGDNVTASCMFGDDYEYKAFTPYYHPHYALPFYLSNFVSSELPRPMFTPLWKYMPESDSFDYEADEDHYVIKEKSKITGSYHTFYYKKM